MKTNLFMVRKSSSGPSVIRDVTMELELDQLTGFVFPL